MTLFQFLSILWARWKIMLLVLSLVVVGTGVVNLLLPKKYTSSVGVLVDVKSPDPIAGIIYPSMSTPAYMATQVDVVQSDRVAQEVVRGLKLNESPALREQWRDATQGRGNLESWVATLIGKSLDVKLSRESNVITITYKSADPKFATALANAYAQAFIDVSLQLRVDPAKQYDKFFEARSKDLRQKVEDSRAKLTTYQRESGIVGTEERFDIESTRLNELSSQLVQLQASEEETASRQAEAKSSADRIQDVINNPVITSLKTDLARQESRLKELSDRLGDRHPSVTELKANIAETMARIDAETARITGAVTVTNTITHTRLLQTQTALDAQRLKVLRMKEARDQLAVLTADVESAQRAYDSVTGRANQTELESGTTQTNLHILNPASEPIDPSSPRVMVNVVVALFVGTLLAVGVAMVVELFDRRVRAASEVVQALDLPLLGVLARKSAGRLFGRKPLVHARKADERMSPADATDPLLGAPVPFAPMTALAATEATTPEIVETGASAVRDVALGDIFRETHKLSADQIEAILAYQRAHGVLFGEAAVALKLVGKRDVMWALSRQFHYPYALESRKHFNPELIAATTPFSHVAETFRSIRSQLIRRFDQDGARRALAVVSADSGDGKTFVAANLAIAFSQLGRRTLLIDADMRSPRLHKVFGIDNSRGLSSILAGRLPERVLTPVADLPSLFVLPVGVAPPNPLELLESPAFGMLIQELLGKFDHIIIDSPSAMVGADAGVIAARSGSFVSVARQGKTCMESMIELVQSLRDSTTLSLGFVLNEY